MRLVIVNHYCNDHFTQWEILEWQEYFDEIKCISMTCASKEIRATDIVFAYSLPAIEACSQVKCKAKFGMLFPGFDYHALKEPEQTLDIKEVIEEYEAIFANEGPVWEVWKTHQKVHLVPYSVAHRSFKKTRTRDCFKKIIQVGKGERKGRKISKASMELMPYEWALYPEKNRGRKFIPWRDLPRIYQQADGFLNPGIVPTNYEADAKYNAATMEAGLSGCIIFWNDCMNLGNSFETVFALPSLEPREISDFVQSTINSIDLETHSERTAHEFYEKCNATDAIKARMKIMKEYIL